METEEEVGGVAGKKRQKGKAKLAVVKKPKLTTPTTTPTKRRKAESVKEACKYGVKCYQTNNDHREKFSHPWVRERERTIYFLLSVLIFTSGLMPFRKLHLVRHALVLKLIKYRATNINKLLPPLLLATP